MIPRRRLLAGLAGFSGLSLAACGNRQSSNNYAYAPPGGPSWTPQAKRARCRDRHQPQRAGQRLRPVRKANILAVIHKSTEGGDWIDPSYAPRRVEAESNGLLWGAYHFGTRQYSGARQAQNFLAAARPTPRTLLALDFEHNDPNPNNTMTLQQAEDFVRVVHRATGRLPIVYTHASWANGTRSGRRGVRLQKPVGPDSILAQCDLWLADPREEPVVPDAWAGRGWRLWQYVANESESDAAYGTASRAVPGVTHCDRNLFAGNAAELHRYWGVGRARA